MKRVRLHQAFFVQRRDARLPGSGLVACGTGNSSADGNGY